MYQFIEFHFDAQFSILTSHWNTTAEMTDEEYKKTVLQYVAQVQKYHPRFSLLDARESAYTVHPIMQAWVNETVKPIYKAGMLEKTAFVMSKHFIAQLSIEQVVDEAADESHKKRQFFDSMDKARQWLIAKNTTYSGRY